MSGQMPPGWGLPPPPKPSTKNAPVSEAIQPQGAVSGRSWDMPVGIYKNAAPEVLEWLMEFTWPDIRNELLFYVETGDESHLWRAWRAARAFGDVPPKLMAMIAPHLDELAASSKSALRAEQRETRWYVVDGYYHEVKRMEEKRPKCAKNLTEARQWVAERFNTTEGAVKQMVMEHEGKGQRGK